jgi:hypothetical protein
MKIWRRNGGVAGESGEIAKAKWRRQRLARLVMAAYQRSYQRK